MESFEDQCVFWVKNGFVGDMVRVSLNSEAFSKRVEMITGIPRPNSKSNKKEKDAWNGYAHLHKHLLNELYNLDDFNLDWLDSGNRKRKAQVIEEIHLSKTCFAPRRQPPQVNGADCAWCSLLSDKLIFPAEEIDHIIPFSFFPQFDEHDWNFQGLCKIHNGQKGSFPLPVQNKMTSEQMLQQIWSSLT